MSAPLLSVVVITPFGFAHVRKAVRHFRAQTIAASLELIIVVCHADSLADARAGELEGFAAVQVLPVGPIPSIDVAATHGFNAALAPLIAYSDDHAYVRPDWAEALVKAFEGPWVAVGTTLENANPATAWSWVNLICSYGWWAEGAAGGECDNLPGHNVTFRRETLFAFAGGPLPPQTLRRESGLLAKLRSRGGRLALASTARSRHMNAATMSSTGLVRFNMGRYYGHHRALNSAWSWPMRLLYILGFPLIPVVRLLRMRTEMGGTLALGGLRIYPALFVGLMYDAIGQAVGYGFGPGDSLHVLENYEVRLRRYVTPAEAVAMDDA